MTALKRIARTGGGSLAIVIRLWAGWVFLAAAIVGAGRWSVDCLLLWSPAGART